MATQNKTRVLEIPQAPMLPIAPVEYGQQYQDQFTNILRLYFNGIDTTFGGLLGNVKTGTPLHPGGTYLA